MKKLRLNAKLRRALWGRSRGFSLIEVVIAIALVGIIGVTILSAMSAATLALIIADNRATAESLAKTQMEYVKSQDYVAAPNGGVGDYSKITEIPTGYTIWSVNRTGPPVDTVVIGIPWDSGNNTELYVDNGLQKITVIVTYYTLRGDSQMRNQTYTLEDYKVDEKIG